MNDPSYLARGEGERAASVQGQDFLVKSLSLLKPLPPPSLGKSDLFNRGLYLVSNIGWMEHM